MGEEKEEEPMKEGEREGVLQNIRILINTLLW